jgi:uncharacterized protein (TIGR02246 family)
MSIDVREEEIPMTTHLIHPKSRRSPKRFRLAVLAALLTIAVPVAAQAAAPEGVQSVDEAWAKAVKAGDLAAVLALYAPDAVAWFPDAPEARGEQAIRAGYEHLFAENVIEDAAFSNAHYKTVGDSSVGWGNFALTLRPKKGGDPVVVKGRFTEVAERRGGRWVYVVDHASGEPAPAHPPAQ